MRRLSKLLVILIGLGTLALGAPEGFTLEQVMSAPFPAELTASPTGGKVAWVFNDRGVRNIWVGEPPDFRGRAVTAFTEDDGQAIGSLVWRRDGEAIVYVRGGSANRQGEIPNPTSDPAGADQSIWIVTLADPEPRRLAEGTSPLVSPAGDAAVFLRKGQIWRVPLDGDGEPEHLFKARGNSQSVRFSPDGARLVFVSDRGDHSFIGLYDVSRKTVRYLDPGVDRDLDPVWSPAGDRIAFVRLAASRDFFTFGPTREAQPWSIRVVDAATGKARQVWKAKTGRGSAFRGTVADNALLWAAGDRLVFPWERDGWVHLYSVPVAGGAARLLTPGEFEVEHVALTGDRRHVVYSSNQGDIDRRSLWRAAADGGKPARVTSGDGIEWSPAPVSGGRALAFLRSDARAPAHAVIKIGDAAPRELAPGTIPGGFPAAGLVEPEQVIFPAADGMKIHGQLFRPRNGEPGKRHPAVLFFHGGSRRQMLLGWHYSSYYHNAYAFNQYLASRGYVVLSVNFRSGIGYGLEFREALNYGAHGASEFNDVLGAGLYLRGRDDVDPTRIGLWGGSYGGYLTALGLARASELFAAGVDFHGVHDWNQVIRNFAPAYDPGKRAELARLAFESSPMSSVDTWRSPVLLIHGDDDRNVPFSETVELAEALRQRDVHVELLVFPDEVHGFLTHARWLEAYRAAAQFLDRQLK